MIEEPPNPRGGTPPTHSRGDGWTSGPRPDPAGTATAWAQLDAVLVTLPRKSCKRDTPGTNNLFTFLQVLSSIPSCLVKNGSNLKKNKVNWHHVGSEIHWQDHSGFTLNRSLAAAFQQELCGT